MLRSFSTDLKSFPDLHPEIKIFFEALLRSYSTIFFSQSRLFGAVLLAATMTVPRFGLFGAAGASVAYVAARLLGFDRFGLRKGIVLLNPLLVSLALAYLESYQPMNLPAFSALLVVASVATLLVSAAMSDLFPRYFALPALSLPFVGGGGLLFYLFHAFRHIPLAPEAPVCLVQAIENLPAPAEGFLQALGAIFFLPYPMVGLMVLAGLAVWSRLAVFHAAAGFLSGVLFMQLLGMDTQPEALGYIGFNFIFCGMALGGIFLIPSFASLVMAALGSCLCVVVASAAQTALSRLGIPPLALPLNLVILLVLYALKCRPRIKILFETPFEPESPETNFRRFALDSARFPGASEPHLQLPFFGGRTVTQSFNGEITHRGEWSEAFDYEILDEAGNRFSHLPLDLDGNYVFGTPVLAPCIGTVARVVSDVPDNAVGDINTDRNWGNQVIIRSEAGWYVTLCHLQQGSVEMAEGDRVLRGQVVGRCGNSGRSPAPHLHMQVQHTDLIGGHTVAFRLARYVSSDETGLRYHASGVPEKGQNISPAGFDPNVAACFEFGETSKTYRFNGRSETVRTSFSVTGDRILSSGAARLTARIKDQTFCISDYKGGPDSVLFYIHLGLARVPFVSGDNISWSDRIDLRPLLRPWAVVLLDMAGPFIDYPMAEAEYRLVRNNDGTLRISSSFKYPVPDLLLQPECPAGIEVRLSQEGICQVHPSIAAERLQKHPKRSELSP